MTLRKPAPRAERRRAASRRDHDAEVRAHWRDRFFRPSGEFLEERLLLKNFVILDFTPDTIANEYTVGRFADVFTPGVVNASNRFLDYDGNSTINAHDAQLASKKIASRVVQLLKPVRQAADVELVVMHTTDLDSTDDPGAGERRLQMGQNSAQQNTYVMYIGDTRPDPDLPLLGMAHQAFSGENNEFYGYVFAGGVKQHLAGGQYRWKPQAELRPIDFTNEVAFAVAHELGHLWGLGHLIDVTSSPANPVTPDNYHHVMNVPKYANPATSRFLSDATHRMEIGDAATGVSSYSHVNALQEVRNSLRTNASGQFVQATIPNSVHPSIPTYKNSPASPGANLGEDNPPPSPATSVPAASTGQADGETVSTIRDSLTAGWNAVRQNHLAQFAEQLNLPDGSLPLLTTDLGSLLGLEQALENALGAINVSSASNMSQLSQQLTNAGFTIDHALTDAQFANLDPNAPADFVRASRTYRLAQISQTTSLNQSGLGDLSDLSDVQLSGELNVLADVYFTVSFGVDTGGFYLVPGNGVLASVAVGGNVSAATGGGTISGNAGLGFSPTVSLKTSASDGRVRLSQLDSAFAAAVERDWTGSAGVNLEFQYQIANTTPVGFRGDWIWDLQPSTGSFTLDAGNSGFDEEALLDSLSDGFGAGLNALAAQSASITDVVGTIPLVGGQLDDQLSPLLADSLAYQNSLGNARSYLAERGFQILSIATPEDFLDGSFANVELLRLQYTHTVAPKLVNFQSSGGLHYEVAGLDVDLTLSGQLHVQPSFEFTMQFGLDSLRGPFVVEGASMSASLPVSGELNGSLSIGNLPNVDASASADFEVGMSYVISDFDSQANEKFYLMQMTAGAMIFDNPQSVQKTGELAIDLVLAIDTPANSLPVIGKYLSDALDWRATATFDLESGVGTYTVDENFLPSLADIEQQLRDEFLTLIDTYNPLPQELRSFLTMDLELFAGKSLAEMLGLGAAEILIDPLKYKGQAEVDVNEDAGGGDRVELTFEFLSPANIAAMLSGQTVDYFRLDIEKTFAGAEITFPVLPETPLATFFGLVTATLEVDVGIGMGLVLDVAMGLDSNGFYILDEEAPVMAVTGEITAYPTLEGDLLGLDFARVTGSLGLAAVGGVELNLPGAVDAKIRARDLYHQGQINTSILGFTLGFDLIWSLKGELGILGVDALTATTKTYGDTYRLFELELGGSQPGNNVFEDLKDEMEQRGKQLVVCGTAAVTFNPVAITACGVLLLPDLIDMAERGLEWLSDRWDDTVDAAREFVQNVGAEAKKVVEKAEEFLEDLAEGVTELFVLLGDGLQRGLEELKKLFGGGEWHTITPQERPPTFTTRVENGVLVVSWLEGHLPGKDWRSDSDTWNFRLPPGYPGTVEPVSSDSQFPLVTVSPDGYFDFNSRRYHVLHDDLTTLGPADDVFLEPSASTRNVTYTRREYDFFQQKFVERWVSQQVPEYYQIRWDATNKRNGEDVQVAARIYHDGEVRYDYGPGNTGLAPRVGVTLGGEFIPISGFDGVETLTDAQSVRVFPNGTAEVLSQSRFTIQPAYDLVGQDDDRAAVISVSYTDGQYIVDGADFRTEEIIAEQKETGIDCYDGCDIIEPKWAEIQHPNRKEIDASGITRVVVYGSSRSDQILLSEELNVPVTLYGFAGDDVLMGTRFDDVIYGGLGNDILRGLAGDDELYGGDGDDRLIGDFGNDLLDGGAGNDVLDEQFAEGVGGDPAARGLEQNELRGGPGDDRLLGSPGHDTMDGGLGADNLYGFAGHDVLRGGPETLENYSVAAESDLLDGGEGNDSIYGGVGEDFVLGGAGDDLLFGGRDGDMLRGDDENNLQTGSDTIHGEHGDDLIFGGRGNDFLYGGDGADIIRGEEGNDLIVGAMLGNYESAGDGNDALYGGPGNDELHGGRSGPGLPQFRGPESIAYDLLQGNDGEDLLYGGSGPDHLDGGRGQDLLEGNGGDDRLFSGPGALGDSPNDAPEILRGGDGNDLLVASDGYLSPVNPGQPKRVIGARLEGGAGNDELLGANLGADVLIGGSGADTISGLGGDDLIYGHSETGSGDDQAVDVLYGDDGDDRLDGQGGNDVLHGGAGDDSLYGGAGADIIRGDDGHDLLVGALPDDYEAASDGNDALFGGPGNDVLYGGPSGPALPQLAAPDAAPHDVLHGEDGQDTLYGGTGPDYLHGGDGEDVLEGNAGADELHGGDGNDRIYGHSVTATGDDAAGDTIFGDAGDDLLYGQQGNDSISGGEGNDRLWGEAGNDTLHGDAGADTLSGAEGDDTAHGGEGPDLIYLGAGADLAFGDEGDDRIYAGAGNDTVAGGTGADRLFGEDGDDQLSGNDGDDYLDGGEGQDNLFGDAGDDYLFAGGGTGGELRGGSGDDILIGTDWGDSHDPDFFDAVYVGDRLYGGDGDDQIWALGGADFIDAGEGDDRVDSGSGSDYVLGGGGNDWIFAGFDFGDTIDGGLGDDEIYGSHAGDDLLRGGAGNDRLFGQGGNDVLEGGAGHDHLDGGGDADVLRGEDGDDRLDGGGGDGDVLEGGDGDDTLFGSDDGADVLRGDGGHDRLYGRGGNDALNGGTGDDVLFGDAGDDVLEGGQGADILVGGAHHDVLHGHTVAGTGDDNAVDHLYGDFATNGDEVDSGNDRLAGGGGNDFLYGEGGDDQLDTGPGSSDATDYGSGEGANAADFVMPPATPAPALAATTALIVAAASLPTGVEQRGRWAGIGNSNSGSGVAGDPAISFEPDVIAYQDTRYVTWTDARSGNYEIYLARETAGAWSQLGGSSQQGGISNTASSSRSASVAVDGSGNPVVAWTETHANGSDIYLRVWNPAANGGAGSWESLESSSSGGGVSNTGTADRAHVLSTSAGIVVVWLDRANGQTNVRSRRFDGNNWVGMQGSDTGGGISSAAADTSGLAVTTNGTHVAVAWSEIQDGVPRVRVREWNGTQWQAVTMGVGGSGVSAAPGGQTAPAVAYFAGELFVAWQQDGTDARTPGSEIYAAVTENGLFVPAGIGGQQAGGISAGRGHASAPQLATGGGKLQLFWLTDLAAQQVDTKVVVSAKSWDGDRFQEAVPGDLADRGVFSSTTLPVSLAAAIDAAGRAFVVANDATAERQEIYLVANSESASGNVRIASGLAGFTVQDLLNSQDFNPGDTILVTGEITQDVTISAADAGVRILGAPQAKLIGNVTVNGAADVRLQYLNITGSVTANQADRFTVRDSSVGSMVIHGGADIQLIRNTTGPIRLGSASSNPQVEENTATELSLEAGGVSGLFARGNHLGTVGILAASSGTVAENEIVSLQIRAAFAGSIENNSIGGGAEGVRYEAPAALFGNKIAGSAVGVVVNLADPALGFGYVGNGQPNVIQENTVGVRVQAGRIRGQYIRANNTGVTGNGVLGGETLETANVIEANEVGADLQGTIQFNRFIDNGTNIRGRSGQRITHNVISGTMDIGIHVTNSRDVRIFDNSIYSASGDNIRIDNSSSEVEVRGNILWSEAGYNIFVAENSQTGYFSDYNTLHVGATGTLVHYNNVDFRDMLDWQVDVNRFDLRSVGTTGVNPLGAQPRFQDRHHHDLQVWPQVAGLDFTSPTRHSGDPRVNHSLQGNWPNLLVNPGFETGVTGWLTNPQATSQSVSPAAYEGLQVFRAGDVAVGEARQTIDFLAAGYSATELDAESLTIAFGGRLRSAAKTIADQSTVALVFLDGDGDELSRVTAAPVASADAWRLAGERVRVPVGARSARFEFLATRQSGPSNDAWLDDAFVRVLPESYAPDQGTNAESSAGANSESLPAISLRAPDLYLDWERDVARDIVWESRKNADNRPVRIDLFQDGPQGPAFLATIVSSTPDDGRFSWTPANSSIDYGTFGLRIQVSLVGESLAIDRSSEPFVVPENSSVFYVNDSSVVNDEYSTAVGSNRNTGRTPASPKPNPVNLLRTYTLGPTHTLYVDQGSYNLHSPIVLSGAGVRGDDEGFTFTGPTAADRETTFRYPHFSIQGPMIELDDADSMVLRHLSLIGGTGGVLVNNGSTDFVANDLVIRGQGGDGIAITGGSLGARLQKLTVTQNVGHGIFADQQIHSILDSTVSSNDGDGIHLDQPRSVIVEGNVIERNDGRGIYLRDADGTTSRIGNDDLTLSRGNRIQLNGSSGIAVNGQVLVAGNVVSGHLAANEAGIFSSRATVVRNVAHGNRIGILNLHSDGAVRENRVYDNQIGIGDTGSGGQIERNVVYSNQTGIQVGDVWYSSSSFYGAIQNNVIYDNSRAAVQLSFAREGATIRHNTIYQPAGDGLIIDDHSRHVAIHDNIIWVEQGAGVNVATDSQVGFHSDFNLLYATENGSIGKWQLGNRQSMTSWRSATGNDLNSLSFDPLFVAAEGPDGILGASGTSDGSDDDFHIQSATGSFHGGALAPAVDPVTGLPYFLPGTYVADSQTSPALDRGTATASFVNEPDPNGGYVNLGAYGNTVQASKSPAQYISVISPSGGETWPMQREFSVRWRSHNLTGTIRVSLLDAATLQSVSTLAENEADDGEFTWQVPGSLPAGNYVIQIATADGTISANSRAIQVSEPVAAYYVNIAGDNDFSDNQYTTAAGDPGNDGLSPATPVESLQTLFNSGVTFQEGDVVYIDSGWYESSANILLTAEHAGITLQGPTTSGKKAIIDRGNTENLSYVFELAGADRITISHLGITGADTGIYLDPDIGNEDVTLTHNEVFENANGGISMGSVQDSGNLNRAIRVLNNTVFGNYGSPFSTGIEARGPRTVVSENVVYAKDTGIDARYAGDTSTPLSFANWLQVVDNIVFNNNEGIVLQNNVLIENNTVYDHNLGASSKGILAFSGGLVRENTVYGNARGIELSGSAVSTANRVFGNQIGIIAGGSSTVTSNRIYSNEIGVQTAGGLISSDFNGRIAWNVIYDNSTIGLNVLRGRSGSLVDQNTLYEPVADAIHIAGFSRDVRLRNNVLSVAEGVAITVAANSEQGFQSDYNLFQLSANADAGKLGSSTFSTLLDWSNGSASDGNSVTADPQFIDSHGPDGVLGFSHSVAGTAVIQESADATMLNSGESDAAVFTLANLTAGGWYRLSANWGDHPSPGFSVLYEISDGDQVLFRRRLDQRWDPEGFDADERTFEPVGNVQLSSTELTVRVFGNWQSGSVTNAIHLVEIVGDGGADANFREGIHSPVIDRGDPLSHYFAEPFPNGGRANMGAFGNTSAAQTSPLQQIQILSPNGGEKVAVGVPLAVQWFGQGLTNERAVLRMNVGGGNQAEWPSEDSLYASHDRFGVDRFEDSLDLSAVDHPAPEEVYRQYQEKESLGYAIPLPDGEYRLRLHLLEPTLQQSGRRVFDVSLQGEVVGAGIDSFIAAGGRGHAYTLDYDVSVEGGRGLDLRLDAVGNSGWDPVLSAIEISTQNPLGVEDPRFDVELSIDGGINWSAIATNQPVDRYGAGTVNWTPAAGQETNGSTALLRVSTAVGIAPTDLSDAAFLIAPGGNEYYINVAGDTDLTDNQYTTAAGNDALSGKDPSQPMASLAALLDTYDFEPGDVIYVDAGMYALSRNIVIGSDDAGVTILGPTAEGLAATFDRGNTSDNSYVFELVAADEVTIAHLAIQGAEIGIFVDPEPGSEGVVIRNNVVRNNHSGGIDFGFSSGDSNANRRALIADNYVHHNSTGSFGFGIRARGSHTEVVGNYVHDEGTGIDASNRLSFSGGAITGEWLRVRDNEVFANTDEGIYASELVLVENNFVHGQNGSTNRVGIRAGANAVIENNEVFDNAIGISLAGTAVASDNVVRSNQVGAFLDSGAHFLANRVHQNETGIETDWDYSGRIANNVVYSNQSWSLDMSGARSGSTVEFNTFHQPTSNGIRIDGDSQQLAFRNNIVSVAEGVAMEVTRGDNTNPNFTFLSDYNLFQTSGESNFAKWRGWELVDLAAWHHALGFDGHSFMADPLFIDVGAFDFHLQPTSPAIDRADPLAIYSLEPSPNGGRGDMGGYGNSPEAVLRPEPLVQVIAPNGNEKLEAGQTVAVTWQTQGLAAHRRVLQINAGGATQGMWGEDHFDSSYYSTDTSASLDLSNITNAPPQEVMRTYVNEQVLDYQLPVADGEYTIRLFLLEPSYSQSGRRLIDVTLQGELVDDNVDPYALAGARNKGVALEYSVQASDGKGIHFTLTGDVGSSSYAILSALEVFAVSSAVGGEPLFDVEVSQDGGNTWTAVAEDLGADRFGNGHFDWSIPADWGTPVVEALVRVTHQGTAATDRSDAPFLVTNGGNAFYVNIPDDTDFSDNEYTTAAGNDFYDGKSPDRPMASLVALLDDYQFEPGDTIYVDTGSYHLLEDLLLRSQHSGVTIQGASEPGHVSQLDRRNLPAQQAGQSSYVFRGDAIQLVNADDLTIANLAITGGYRGVVAETDAGSESLTLRDNRIFGNADRGIHIARGNDGALLVGNRVHDHTESSNAIGIEINGYGHVVRNNEVFGNESGISIPFSSNGNDVQVLDNVVHDNDHRGIYATSGVLVSGNRVYRHTGTSAGQFGDAAIYLNSAIARDNIVFSNHFGLRLGNNSVAQGNRVYDNQVGIWHTTWESDIRNNWVYSNVVGIRAMPESTSRPTPRIENNLIYANSDRGILLHNAIRSRIANNTVFQVVGDAIRIQNSSTETRLANNILWVESGHNLFVDSNSKFGLLSNDNLFYRGADPNAAIGSWDGVARLTLSDWQQTTGSDDRSLEADPLFVDRNGADNLLGYNPQTGIDGSLDDNFQLSKGSPAIDRGDSEFAPARDLLGKERSDDPGTPGNSLIDLGAWEFAGSTLDETPPFIVGSQLVTTAEGLEIQILFSEAIDPLDAWSTANYELRTAGPNGTLGDGDDQELAFVPRYEPGTLLVVLQVTTPGVSLQEDQIELVVHGSSTIHDLSGLKLDGDADGEEGGNFVSANRAPVVVPLTSAIIAEGTELSVQLQASDPDGDALTYAIESGAPAGVEIDPSTGLFRWTPSETQAPGNYVVIFRVADDGAPSISVATSLTIQTSEVNDPPVIQTLPDQTAQDGVPLVFIATATDPEGQSVTFSLGSGAPSGASIDATTGAFQWTPSDSQSPGNYTITIVATDAGSPARSSSREVAISVSEFNDPPTLLPIANQFVSEGRLLEVMVQAIDPEQQDLTYAFDGQVPSGMAIHPATGVVTWTPDETLGGESFPITVRVTDSGVPSQSVTRTFNVTVTELNSIPIPSGPASLQVPANQLLTAQFSATDTDEPAQRLTFSLLSGAPTGAAIDPLTAQFHWTPQANQLGDHVIGVRVTDDGSPARSATLSVTVTVTAGNDAPVLTNPGNQEVSEGETLTFALSASDDDETSGEPDTIEYSITTGALPGMTLNATSGAFSWTPLESQDGEHVVVFRATDNHGAASDEQSVTITVTEVNESPTLNKPSNSTITPGQQLHFVFAASDPDTIDGLADTLRFSIVSGSLPGMELNRETGEFTWTPESTQVGTHSLTFRVSDEQDASADQSLLLTVEEAGEDNKPPTAITIENLSVEENAFGQIVGSITVEDPNDGQTHTLTVSDDRFEIVSGQLKLKDAVSLDFETAPSISVTITAVDSGDPPLELSQSFSLTVVDKNDAPHGIALAPATVKQNVSGQLIGTLQAEDDDAQQLHEFAVSDDRFEIVDGKLQLRSDRYIEIEGGTIELEITVTDSGEPSQSSAHTIVIDVIANPKAWLNTALPFDTNGDGAVVPLDALRIINQLNNPTLLEPNGRLPTAREFESGLPYYDANGDGFCTSNDVLRVINYLNNQLGEGEAAARSAGSMAETLPSVLPLMLPAVEQAIGDLVEDSDLRPRLIDEGPRPRRGDSESVPHRSIPAWHADEVLTGGSDFEPLLDAFAEDVLVANNLAIGQRPILEDE